jgi:hypothetical protein
MPPTGSIYDIVVYPSCRRLPSILLAITAGTLVASVLVKHGSILTAGIVSVYAVQPLPVCFCNTLPGMLLSLCGRRYRRATARMLVPLLLLARAPFTKTPFRRPLHRSWFVPCCMCVPGSTCSSELSVHAPSNQKRVTSSFRS